MKDIITNELSKALKNGDKERIHTLRLIIAAIKDKEIASRSSGEDSEILEETVKQKKHLLISTGLSNYKEIKKTIDFLKKKKI